MAAKKNPKAADVLAKDDLIVIGGAGGFIGGALARRFHEQGFTRIRAIDKKPLPEWYQRTPGVECLCMDLSQEKNCKRACEGRGRGLQPRGRHGRHGLHRAVPHRVPAQHPDQHAHDRVGLAGRGQAVLLLVVGLRLQRRAAEEPRRAGAEGIGRLSRDGRARLRLGEAHERDVLPGVLGRARLRDAHRPVPQRLRPLGHLGRRPREGARRDLPQGDRGQGHRAARTSRSGATGTRPAASCTSTIASRAST